MHISTACGLTRVIASIPATGTRAFRGEPRFLSWDGEGRQLMELDFRDLAPGDCAVGMDHRGGSPRKTVIRAKVESSPVRCTRIVTALGTEVVIPTDSDGFRHIPADSGSEARVPVALRLPFCGEQGTFNHGFVTALAMVSGCVDECGAVLMQDARPGLLAEVRFAVRAVDPVATIRDTPSGFEVSGSEAVTHLATRSAENAARFSERALQGWMSGLLAWTGDRSKQDWEAYLLRRCQRRRPAESADLVRRLLGVDGGISYKPETGRWDVVAAVAGLRAADVTMPRWSVEGRWSRSEPHDQVPVPPDVARLLKSSPACQRSPTLRAELAEGRSSCSRLVAARLLHAAEEDGLLPDPWWVNVVRATDVRYPVVRLSCPVGLRDCPSVAVALPLVSSSGQPLGQPSEAREIFPPMKGKCRVASHA